MKVLTTCSEFGFNGNDFKALVYEFMSNGSLDEWLHPMALQYSMRSKLSLLGRVNIAIDVACALDYLHHHCETPIVHYDLKPSNVLLDDEMTVHVGNSDLSEYGSGSAVAIEGDMYSFGILVLEMFIGKRPTDDMFENGLNLHRFAKEALADQVDNVIDSILLQEHQESEKR
ncbi:probable LRR receptor-like serine/threonine-protein kinase At3g47570 [Syzygium oleosum]|uniref:probable LRR receptor-like serine/threonine-protein kinase At3g47570 n=1 Tax=Syzygium oleosum TaxID=219896 RepID=UPI0024B9917D|nr:probable LRR receptor-like serine/threonine-protein kinase At3g47570 [Syzygium oleosum]